MTVRRKTPKAVLLAADRAARKNKIVDRAALATKADEAERTSAWREKMRKIREQCE